MKDIYKELEELGITKDRLTKAMDSNEDWGHLVHAFEFVTVISVVLEGWSDLPADPAEWLASLTEPDQSTKRNEPAKPDAPYGGKVRAWNRDGSGSVMLPPEETFTDRGGTTRILNEEEKAPEVGKFPMHEGGR